MEAVKQK